MTAAVTDFSQFSHLRARADTRDPEVLREVAGQFESLFIQTMFKNMRDTSLADPIFGQSDQHEMYQDMLDKQYALEMAGGRGIGLADMLVRQLGGDNPVTASPEQPLAKPIERSIRITSRPDDLRTMKIDAESTWSTPEDFAQQVWPYAQRAARKLNVSPVALVAQAALETGWGEHVMQRPDGSSSLNLFGIKASNSWSGGTVTKPTIEYSEGVLRRERATFRAYPDLAATFDDYAEFIGEHPRYRSVINHGDDSAGFATALQESGYATDPNYADKITAILDSNVMKKALQWLKESTVGPITHKHSLGEGP